MSLLRHIGIELKFMTERTLWNIVVPGGLSAFLILSESGLSRVLIWGYVLMFPVFFAGFKLAEDRCIIEIDSGVPLKWWVSEYHYWIGQFLVALVVVVLGVLGALAVFMVAAAVFSVVMVFFGAIGASFDYLWDRHLNPATMHWALSTQADVWHAFWTTWGVLTPPF